MFRWPRLSLLFQSWWLFSWVKSHYQAPGNTVFHHGEAGPAPFLIHRGQCRCIMELLLLNHQPEFLLFPVYGTSPKSRSQSSAPLPASSTSIRDHLRYVKPWGSYLPFLTSPTLPHFPSLSPASLSCWCAVSLLLFLPSLFSYNDPLPIRSPEQAS